MRGLKHAVVANYNEEGKSHLLQMRGLKLILTVGGMVALSVASFTDAWIETCIWVWIIRSHTSHLLQMRGLKLRYRNSILPT